MEAPWAEAVIDGVVCCGCCGRFPLVGENVTAHAGRKGHGKEWACQTCEADGRAARLGSATVSERVRSLGGVRNVRLRT